MATVMRERWGEDAYPIGRFIFDRATALGLSRTELVRRLGYGNLTNGHRALSDLLTSGVMSALISSRLAAALETRQDLLDTVLLATEDQREDEAVVRRLEWDRAYRGDFRPHLQVQTERQIPSPIFVAALLGSERLLMVSLPDHALTADEHARDAVVKGIIQMHYKAARGDVPAFGAITGYVLVVLSGYGGSDFGIPFDVSGTRIGGMRPVERLSHATLGTKRGDARLTGLLKDAPVEIIEL